MTSDQVRTKLRRVKGWGVRRDKFSRVQSLQRKFAFKDFSQALRFVKNVAKVAENYGHHPDIHLVRYSNVIITIYTHSMNGLTNWDFALASLIDEVKIK